MGELFVNEQSQLLIVYCKDCWKRETSYQCPMRHLVYGVEGKGWYQDYTTDYGFCNYGEMKIGPNSTKNE